MSGFQDLIARAKSPLELDEATIAFLSEPATLDAIERLEDALAVFKAALGRQFLQHLRDRLGAVAAASEGDWTFVETARVETYLGLKPAGHLVRFADDFWPVFAFSTSPGLPFGRPWLGLFTTPRADARVKTELFERTKSAHANPRDRPADWWVHWDWVPDWPDVSRPRQIAQLVGAPQTRLVEAVADWCAGQALTAGEVLRREMGEGW